MDNAVEVIGIDEGLMGEKVALQIAPGPLDVVQLWGVFRQPFDSEPISGGQSGARGFAGMDGTVIEDQDDRFVVPSRARPVAGIETAEEGDKIAAALGGAGADGQLVGGKVEGANDRPFLRLALDIRREPVKLGPQPETVGSTRLFVVPNPSPANAHFTPADQAAWYDRVADFLEGKP